MIIVVQTNIPGRVDVWICDRRGLVVGKRTRRFDHFGADNLLAETEALRKQLKIGWPKIYGLAVVRGPGRFSAVRIAIVVANILAWVNNKPIKGLVSPDPLTPSQIRQVAIGTWAKKFTAVKPYYGQAPNITKPKS